MYGIRTRYAEEQSKFNDIDALGIFVDNHDNARFLNGNSNTQRFRNALVFTLTARGIPIVYYGSEQNYAGGNDPHNREPLWTAMNKATEQY
jgi:alpha-amylase